MTEPSKLPHNQLTSDDDAINPLDLLIVLAKHKKLLLGLPFLVAVLAAVITLLQPNIYTATTRIVTPQQSQSTASALVSQMGGGLAGLVGGLAGVRNPSDFYIGMLKSRSVADSIIQRFELNKGYKQELQSNTRKILAGRTMISAGKDGIITIECDDKDPKMAAELANAYVDELFKLTTVLAVTDASQRRLFFERQFALAKDNLVKAEMAARQALEKGGLVKVDDQGRAMVETTARLRAQITVKEVQIGAMRTFAADRNPDLRMAQQELESLKHELAKLEGAGGIKWTGANSDGKGIDNLRLLRDVKYYETIYEVLARQFEIAKIDEAKDAAVIQVLDKAIEPDYKSKPFRSLIVLISALVAGVVAVVWAFAREAMERAKNDPQQAERLARLRSYLRAGRRSSVT